jgi:hypothetical protein
LAGCSVSSVYRSRSCRSSQSQTAARLHCCCCAFAGLLLACCSRAAADTRPSNLDTTVRRHTTHHSRSDDTSFFCLTTTHSHLTTSPSIHHSRQQNYAPSPIRSKPIHPLFTTLACLPVPLFVARDRSPCISLHPYTFQPLRLEFATRAARDTLQTQLAPSTTV